MTPRNRNCQSPIDPITWARSAAPDDYLSRYADDGLSADDAPSGSRCGHSDVTLDGVERVLRARGLTLVANDRGLVARSR